jgi:Activator of Hsp90 ATPase homolog 1-like protein
MSEASTEALSVVVEREMPFPPEKIWRALTQPHLIEEWLMKNDFMPVVGRHFNLRRAPQPDLNIVVACEVFGGRAEQDAGLHVGRLWPRERRHLDSHADARGDPPAHGARPAYLGAKSGWRRFFAKLEEVLARTA